MQVLTLFRNVNLRSIHLFPPRKYLDALVLSLYREGRNSIARYNASQNPTLLLTRTTPRDPVVSWQQPRSHIHTFVYARRDDLPTHERAVVAV